MQKPLIIAVVGKGRSCSCWNVSQPSLTSDIMSSADSNFVNSSTSAPATKPSFAEQMLRPRGLAAAICSSVWLSSRIASRLNVLADSPCLSKVSQIKPSRSFSHRQCFASTCGSARSILSPLIFLLECFDEHGAAEAAADADARHSLFLARALQCLEQMQHDARARGADRMAQRDCPAVDIEFFFI